MKEYEEWLARARSCLALARVPKSEEILWEDLCFQAQQSAEKSLKALLIACGETPPRTHDMVVLLQSVARFYEIPGKIKKVITLNNYAVQIRYPGDYTPIYEDEYEDAVGLAEDCLAWVLQSLRQR